MMRIAIIIFTCLTGILTTGARSAEVYPEGGHVELGRRTVEQYAGDKGKTPSDIRRRFAATGVLECEGWFGGASLVNSNTTIATSAHMFITKPKGSSECVHHRLPEQCSFTVETLTGKTVIPVQQEIEIGFRCPDRTSSGDDWAVLKLRQPAQGVEFYRTPRRDEIVKPSDSVIAVNARNRDIFYDTGGKRYYPKTIEECDTRWPFGNFGRITEIESTCDSSEMTSGSPLISMRADGDVLVAITTGNYETLDASTAALKKGVRIKKEYARKEWASVHRPVDGRLLEVLEEQR